MAGYCYKHHKWLTVGQIKYKKCLGKTCHYFRKNEEHPWWKQRELKKVEKKTHRIEFNNKIARLMNE